MYIFSALEHKDHNFQGFHFMNITEPDKFCRAFCDVLIVMCTFMRRLMHYTDMSQCDVCDIFT